MKILVFISVLGLGLAAFAAEPQATAVVTIDPTQALGPIRTMNAVNNGPAIAPVGGDQKRGNFTDYKAARIPYARLHDSINCVAGGAHAVDVNAIFPDFDADENDPENYDFVFTDHYLDTVRRAGTEVFYRLGQTIEHGPKKYGALPPKDYAKWARICEHIIRHYNEGWAWNNDKARTTQNIAWSNQFNVVYWEIWNEPDLDYSEVELPKNPRCWGGTITNFFEFYSVAAKHLKGKFPELKIGGPAICGNEGWAKRFLGYCHDHEVPVDFFSWHVYAEEPRSIAEKCVRMRKLIDDAGYPKAESILNEWNYVKGWTDDWVYSLEVESGRFNQKSAAFIASTMIDCQHAPLDMLMYYDARTSTLMNGLFDRVTLQPMRGYYPYLAWSRLVDLGEEIGCTVKEGRGTKSDAATGIDVDKKLASDDRGSFRAVAAKGKDGRQAVMIARYSRDNNVTDTAKVWVSAPGTDFSKARCHITDPWRIYTEVPLVVEPDGTALLNLQPDSFAIVEW